MNLFDVYPLFDITPIRAKGAYIYDKNNQEYLDFYGGHAVISIGHSHPDYTKSISNQLNEISFYSNAVKMPLQSKLAEKLGEINGYSDYNLFLCNSGTEANENAMKLASFYNGRKKIVAIKNSFHGRTSLSVSVTDDEKIAAPVNKTEHVVFIPMNDIEAVKNNLDETVCAVIIEGIQGVGGINIPDKTFLETIASYCEKNNIILIFDEIQSGYGRSGKFFAHQHHFVKPDIITIAKGMGNGFPVAGVLIHPKIKAKHGMLGTTFGGAYLACVACLSVLEIIKNENLIENAASMGTYLIDELNNINGVKKIKGVGLMIGIETDMQASEIRKQLLFDKKIFTGYSSANNTIRLLPPLNISKTECDKFLTGLKTVLKKQLINI